MDNVNASPDFNFTDTDADIKKSNKEVKKSKKIIIILIVVMLLILGAIVTALILLLPKTNDEESQNDDPSPHTPIISQNTDIVKYYSPLTGVEVASQAATTAPTFCIQVPNGDDGARPQAGLDKAGVIFEAIAEAGITRFAAIFQDVGNIPVIGPMRSLRLYYLEWDTPFDCTIVHDGGSDEAVAAARAYKDFTNFGPYVWRSDYNYKLNRLWNNEFTSGPYLLNYNSDRGFAAESNVQGFTHLTPKESTKHRAMALSTNPLDIDTGTDTTTKEIAVKVSTINLSFGGWNGFDPVYHYDPATNTYPRSYASGETMITYDCTGQSGELTPETTCPEKQIAPSVVIAMRVEEHTAWDNYHQNIRTVGQGAATVFQNGEAIEGTWQKESVSSQIRFFDNDGQEIALAPGQVIVSAIPQFGSVSWE